MSASRHGASAVVLAGWLGEKLGGPWQALPGDPKATSPVANIPRDAFAPPAWRPGGLS